MTEKREESESRAVEEVGSRTDFIPPHTHTPDEVAWDSSQDPKEPATIGHLLALHDRQTTLSRRISEQEKVQKRQAIALLLLAATWGILLVAAMRKSNG